jgi:hypothetical protein
MSDRKITSFLSSEVGHQVDVPEMARRYHKFKEKQLDTYIDDIPMPERMDFRSKRIQNYEEQYRKIGHTTLSL